jgi:hypothetical protein
MQGFLQLRLISPGGESRECLQIAAQSLQYITRAVTINAYFVHQALTVDSTFSKWLCRVHLVERALTGVLKGSEEGCDRIERGPLTHSFSSALPTIRQRPCLSGMR